MQNANTFLVLNIWESMHMCMGMERVFVVHTLELNQRSVVFVLLCLHGHQLITESISLQNPFREQIKDTSNIILQKRSVTASLFSI